MTTASCVRALSFRRVLSRDGRWRLVRTKSGPQPNSARWEVHEATDQPEEWRPSAAFAKRRDAKLFLEERITQPTASRPDALDVAGPG